ncbi:MAG: hypothetical protein JJU05_19105, partial [Verrucomicrobia bacterium]|nr:hypothetical protein [Verrucomicrobiota bacterium]
MKYRFLLSFFAMLLSVSLHAGEETDQCYDLFIYHGVAHTDYQSGGGKNHGRTKPYTYIGSITGWALNNGVNITYQGSDSRIFKEDEEGNKTPCLETPGDLLNWRFRLFNTTSIRITHDNQLVEGSDQNWKVNCVQKNTVNLGDSTYAAAGVIAVRRGLLKEMGQAQFSANMQSMHQLQGLNESQMNWLNQNQVERAMEGLFPEASACGLDYYVTRVVNNREDRNSHTNNNAETMQVIVPLRANPMCGGGGNCTTFTPAGWLAMGNECVHMQFYLGQDAWLNVYTETPVQDFRDPDVLRIPPQPGILTHLDAHGQVDQIYTGSHLTVLTPVQTDDDVTTHLLVELFETANPLDPLEDDYLHTLPADPQPVSTLTIERLDSLGHDLRFHGQRNGTQDHARFLWEEDIENVQGRNGWTLIKGPENGDRTATRKVERRYEDNGIEYLEVIDWTLDPDTLAPFTRIEKLYRNFPSPETQIETVLGWEDGERVVDVYTLDSLPDWRLIEQTEGFTGDTRTTTFDYYTAAAGAALEGLPKSTQYPDGNWSRTVYDAQGRTLKDVRSYQDNAFSTADAANRVTEYDYTPLGNDPGDNTTAPRTVTESVNGQIVSRRFTVYEAGQTRRIQAATPTSAWDDPDNLVTTTFYVSGEPRVTLRPDGLVSTTHTTYMGDFQTVTRANGKPDALPVSAATQVEEGTKTVTVTHRDFGYAVSTHTYRVTPAADILLSGHEVLDRDDEFRPLHIVHIDGTEETRTYSCCGLASETNRDGITTTHQYDELRRRIASTR